MTPNNEVRELECDLTDEEMLEKSKEISFNLNQKSKAEDRKKSFNSQIKSEVDQLNKEINILSEAITTGKEFRDVNCTIIDSPDGLTRSWVRTDTGETVQSRPLRTDELQQDLIDNTEEDGNDAE